MQIKVKKLVSFIDSKFNDLTTEEELIKIKVIDPVNAFDRMVIDEVIGEFKELLNE